MTISITLQKGGTARLLQTDGDRTIVESPVASPPGSTLIGSLDGVAAEFQLKVKSCQLSEEGFRIEGRLRNATRELKARLLEG